MANIISETFYGSREPQWLVESPKEEQSHFDRRGCVRQIRTSGYRSNSSMHTPVRNENLPTRSSYPLQQPSVVNADHPAYVYNAVPATHRTVDRPALNTLNITSANIPVVEFMVPLCCGKCEEKVKEELENVEGVYMVVCDQHNQRVAVSSNLDPQLLLKRVKRVKKNSHFWSGSTYLKNFHHAPTFPSDQLSHHSLVHSSDIPAYKPESAHHRITSRMSGQNQRYVPPRSPYDDVETHYLKRKSVGAQAEDPEFYYAGAEHQYKSSSHGSTPFRTSLDAQVYTTQTPFIRAPIRSSHYYGHLPSSYGRTYESEDYAMSSTGYY